MNKEEYIEDIKLLLSFLPDSGKYKWAWDECTPNEQDLVKQVREEFESKLKNISN